VKKQPVFTVPIDPRILQRFKILHWETVRSPFRQASIASTRNKLLAAIDLLHYEIEKCNGYPSSSVSGSFHYCQDALLLLSQLELDLAHGGRSTCSLIGNPNPCPAEIGWLNYKQKLLDARLINLAETQKTNCLSATHLSRLAEIRPDLIAPAPAGSSN
jgi:hypothetical protein